MKAWVKHNKLEDMTSLSIHYLNDLTPSGTLLLQRESRIRSSHYDAYYTLKELYNLYRYIQHLILESKYDDDDEEFDNPLDEENWLLIKSLSVSEKV